MPQMAPINWISLFIMFSMIFILFNSMNYFSFNYPIKKYKTTMKKKLINWKW
uniref:ATP synthase complex subunit 8 n=1 Tax=Tropisternus sp. BYU-CO166 TaxID=696091 RepID=D8WKH5_9COLE|nr:ATP synthase F0 subunit 8 [Tropisternus sp. BYU-CO166]ACZ58508.1 ATP synthase F0 subunit 8 [Tropisternus sp. BYU-CO166]